MSKKLIIKVIAMSRGLFKYLQRKRKERLFGQWVERGELPPEEVPLDVLEEQPIEEADLAGDEIQQQKILDYSALNDLDRGIIRLPIRYVLILVSTIVVLLVALSVVSTILIIRP